MKATFILKNKTQSFYDRLKEIPDCNLFEWLKNQNIQPKIGNDTFREKLEFNMLYKGDGKFSTPTIEPRRGYELLTIHLI